MDEVINYLRSEQQIGGKPKPTSENKSNYSLRPRKRPKYRNEDREDNEQERVKVTKSVSLGRSEKKVHESWYNSSIFKKRCSSVGAEFQVPFIPKAGSYLDEKIKTSESL